MATSQARAGPGLERISRSLAHKVITIMVRLKQQNVTNPVVRETDSSKRNILSTDLRIYNVLSYTYLKE